MIADPTILRMKYSRIIAIFAKMKGITVEDAMDLFYNSTTFRCIDGGISDMHTLSDKYLAEELCREIDEKRNS